MSAKLSTPSHECAVTYADEHGVPIFRDGKRLHCPYPAYKRGDDSKWYCRTHLRTRKGRQS